MTHVISAGSMAGPHNRKKGQQNQDSYFVIQEKDITVIAVADGAGSLKLSHIGSQLAACTASQEALDCILDGNTLSEAVQCGVEKARDALLERDDKKDIGCTLAVAVISSDGWAAGVVGDAFAVISFDDDSHKMIQPESDAEFANVTKLLTSKDYAPLYNSGSEEPLAVAASSDGLLQVALKDNKPLQGFWTPIVKRVSEDNLNVEAFLEHMDISGNITDDTTLVVAANIQAV